MLYSNIKILRKLLGFEEFKIERKVNSSSEKTKFGFEIFSKLRYNFSLTDKIIENGNTRRNASKENGD